MRLAKQVDRVGEAILLKSHQDAQMKHVEIFGGRCLDPTIQRSCFGQAPGAVVRDALLQQ
jgi:hypothetical protein